MRHTPLLFVIGMTLSACVAAGGQAAEAGALSASLRADLQNERFQMVTSLRGLPLGVRDGLQTLFGGTAPGGLATEDDVRKAVLAGRIKGPATVW